MRLECPVLPSAVKLISSMALRVASLNQLMFAMIFDTQALPIDFQWLRTPGLDASVLSDEGGRGEDASFTDCLVGMVAFDVSGGAQAADFNYFEYKGS